MTSAALPAALPHAGTIRASAAVGRHTLAIGLLACAGAALHLYAYGALQPVAVALVYYAIGAGSLRLARAGSQEGRVFRNAFATGWLMAGISAVYANVFQDEGQLFNDAGNFFALSSGISKGLSLEQLRTISEGAGAIVLWRAIYDAFAWLGFAKGRYIGILVNVLCIAWTGVFSVLIARRARPWDVKFPARVASLYPWAGVFWLFASLHLRDGVILLGVTTLLYVWVRYLTRPNWKSITVMAFASLAGFGYFGTLRTEFVFVPAAMLAAGLAAKMFFGRAKRRHAASFAVLAGLALLGILGYVLFAKSDLGQELSSGYEAYSKISGGTDEGGSLGNALIVKAPLPVRMVLGTLYLFIFPIPFWHGFQLESAYHLYKSLNVLFYYATLPLFALTLRALWIRSEARSQAVMFLAFVLAGFTLAICMTSLETRHFGAFQAPFVILAALPDSADPAVRARYRSLSSLFLFAMASIHLIWICLKLA